MSGFYEVTAASGVVAAGDESCQRHQYGPAHKRVIPSPPAPSWQRRTPPRAHHTQQARQAHRTYTAHKQLHANWRGTCGRWELVVGGVSAVGGQSRGANEPSAARSRRRTLRWTGTVVALRRRRGGMRTGAGEDAETGGLVAAGRWAEAVRPTGGLVRGLQLVVLRNPPSRPHPLEGKYRALRTV
jgi:hypothetical protein